VQAQYVNDDRLGKSWPVFLVLVSLCITPNGRNHGVTEADVDPEHQWFPSQLS